MAGNRFQLFSRSSFWGGLSPASLMGLVRQEAGEGDLAVAGGSMGAVGRVLGRPREMGYVCWRPICGYVTFSQSVRVLLASVT